MCVFYEEWLHAMSLVCFLHGHRARKTVCLQPKWAYSFMKHFSLLFLGWGKGGQAVSITPKKFTETRTWEAASGQISSSTCLFIGLIIVFFPVFKKDQTNLQSNIRKICMFLWNVRRMSMTQIFQFFPWSSIKPLAIPTTAHCTNFPNVGFNLWCHPPVLTAETVHCITKIKSHFQWPVPQQANWWIEKSAYYSKST